MVRRPTLRNMVNLRKYATMNPKLRWGINFPVRSGRRATKADLSRRKAYPVAETQVSGSGV